MNDEQKKELKTFPFIITILLILFGIMIFIYILNKNKKLEEENYDNDTSSCETSKMNIDETSIVNFFNTSYVFNTINTENKVIRRSPLLSLLSYNFNDITPTGITMNSLNLLNMLSYSNINELEEDQLYINKTSLSKNDFMNSRDYVNDIKYNCYYKCKDNKCKKECDNICKDNSKIKKELLSLGYNKNIDEEIINDYCTASPKTSLTYSETGIKMLSNIDRLKEIFRNITGEALLIDDIIVLDEFYKYDMVSYYVMNDSPIVYSITCVKLVSKEGKNLTVNYKAKQYNSTSLLSGTMELKYTGTKYQVLSNKLFDSNSKQVGLDLYDIK